MKRILYISHDSFLSGANRSLLGLVKNIRSHEVEPIVLLPRKGEFSKQLEKEKIQFIIGKYYWCYHSNCLKSFFIDKIKFFLNFYFRKNLLKKLKKLNFDLIHINTSVIIDTGLYLSKKLKVKNVIHFREYGKEDHNLICRFGLKKLMKKVEKYSSSLIFISEDLKKYFDIFLEKNLLKNRFVIYNGIERDKDIYTKKYNKEKKLCMIGTISAGKNQLEVIKVMEKIIKEYPVVKLYIFGEGNKTYVEEIKKIIIEKKVEKNVYLMGKIQNPMEKLKEMDIGIMSSKREAFGRVTIEYLLNKLAVIASNSGANTEIIKNGETGLIYELGNEKDLEEKIKCLLNDDIYLKEMASKGYQMAINNFTAEKNAKEIYEKVYKIL